MKNTVLISTLAMGISVQADSYKNAIQFLKSAPEAITNVMNTAPDTYEFKSQFSDKSSVAYTGQSFRQVLVNDLKKAMSSQLRGSYPGSVAEAKNMLMSYYNYNENTTLTGIGVIDGFTDFTTKAYSPNKELMTIAEGFVYSDIQSPGKNIYKKMAGVDNPLRRGKLYGTQLAATPDEYINVLFDMFADNAVNGKSFTVPNGTLPAQTITGANVTENGLDLTQLAQKFIHGALSYSQAARDYLSVDLGESKGLNADNTKPAKQGKAYTAMEHHFDEAFGYFGGARDYKLYGAKLIASKVAVDTDQDGFISVLSELNTGLATNFARMDVTAADQDVDFSGTVINAFLAGRQLIAEKPAGYKDYVWAQGQVALGAWERTFAAVTIHYINFTMWQYNAYGTQNYLFKNFVKFWGEMKGFAFAFQFNPNGTMTDKTFDEIHRLMGDAPVLPHAEPAKVTAYYRNLMKARDLIKDTYGFSAKNVSHW